MRSEGALVIMLLKAMATGTETSLLSMAEWTYETPPGTVLTLEGPSPDFLCEKHEPHFA